MHGTNEIVIFETKDKSITLNVNVADETVWLNRMQMAELFGRDVKTIGKHIANAKREELENEVVVAKFATTTPHGAMDGKTQTHMVEYYNLEMIQNCSEKRRTILSRAVSVIFINPLEDRMYTRLWRKRRQIFFIL